MAASSTSNQLDRPSTVASGSGASRATLTAPSTRLSAGMGAYADSSVDPSSRLR